MGTCVPQDEANLTRVDLVFRNFTADMKPGPGELFLWPCQAAGPERRGCQYALLALEKGIKGFSHGAEPLQSIVIQEDPTLDDMLAAEFLRRQLDGKTLPEGCRAFAHYAANVREGLQGSQVSLEVSLEGIYLAAIRRQAGPGLATGEGRASFLADWDNLAGRILQAAQEGLDPAHSPFLATHPEFARARAYLAQDREVYQHQDVPRGQRWIVQIPGGPQRASGLVLREPRSFLWKYWSREDAQSPTKNGYFFLAVYERAQHWRFSTNPLQRVPITGLAEVLQKEELAKSNGKGAEDPWYDGRRHQGTLIGAPRGGTVLPDEVVLNLVRRWARVQKPGTMPLGFRTWSSLAAAILVAVGLGWWSGWMSPSPQPLIKGNLIRGLDLPAIPGENYVRKGKDYALFLATDQYDKGWSPLANPVHDAQKLAKILSEDYGFETEVVVNPTLREMVAALDRYSVHPQDRYSPREYNKDDQFFIFFAGHGTYHSGTGQGCLVAKDSDHQDDLKLSYLKFSDLKEKIEKHPCPHVFLILDVCHAGTIDFKNSMAWETQRGDNAHDPLLEKLIGEKMQYITRRYFTSCNQRTAADGSPGDHSPFAKKLITALAEGKKHKVVNLDDLWRHIWGLGNESRRGSFEGNHHMSDFLFVSKKEK